VPTIGNAIEAFLDDAKERVERLEVVEVGDRRRHDGHRPFPNAGALEVAIIGYSNEPPLQAINGILAVAIVFVAFRWLLGDGLRRCDRMPPRRSDHHRTRT
jgi:hypothetical protein